VTFEGHFRDIFTTVIACAQLTRNLLAIAKFLVLFVRLVVIKLFTTMLF